MPATVRKAVCHVVQDGNLLVFTHLERPMHITGVQVPALDRRGNPPAHGEAAETWECRWLPLERAHVLAAGLGARLGKLAADDEAAPRKIRKAACDDDGAG